jgi:AraC family transcriptional regulator of adaptative response / DNA-3-methyladenine glycosylase II
VLTTIAFTAGFASIRQFNETMQEAFGCAPSELRRRILPGRAGEGKLTLRLQCRPPFDAEALLTYLGRRALPGVEEVIEGRYRRTIVLPRSRGDIEIEPISGTNAVFIHLHLTELSDLSLLVQRCRQLFDLDADPSAITQVLAADAILAPLVAMRPGLRIPGAISGFELAVRAILGQQVSVAGARTLAGRLVKACGESVASPSGTLAHFFPTPQQVMQANMQGLGITQARINALQALAHAIVEEGLVLDRDANREQTMAQLLKLPGVGPWTASYIAMRALGDPDALPVTDLGLRRAFEQRGLAADPRSIAVHAEAWRPWRAYATHHLWASLTNSLSEAPILSTKHTRP